MQIKFLRPLSVFAILLFFNNLMSQDQIKLPVTLHLRLPGVFNFYHKDIGIGVSFPIVNKHIFRSWNFKDLRFGGI